MLQVLLIFVNAFFAATEIAVISLNDNRLRRQAESGDKTAALMLKIAQEPNSFLSTIQIGITLAGYIGAAFAAQNFSDRLTEFSMNAFRFEEPARNAVSSVSVLLITIVLSFFTLAFGELVPKRIAMQKPEPVARFASRIIKALSVVMRPVIWLLSKLTNGILRILGIDPNADPEEVSEEEILYMVDVGEEKGAIETSEKEMIANIFEFNNTTAADVMVHRTDAQFLWADDSEETILEVIQESGFSRFPVCGEDTDDILGILITRDFLLNLSSKDKKPIKELLRAPYFVPESVRADILFRNMQSNKTHMAIVVDEHGGTGGLVTMEDLIEEIVGNIYDESDKQDEHEITPLEDGCWRIAGSTLLSDIADELGVLIPESDEFDTLNGLIVDNLSYIPDDGTCPTLTVDNLNIQVEQVQDRRIEWAIVSVQRPALQLAEPSDEVKEKK
ncbi:MAG: hemolysin family protein [Eubacteriales bacterium]|nr:hemolysin family protein [Eubacteriales bacterium]